MRTAEADILIVPGLDALGPDHWQSRWAAKLPTARLMPAAPDGSLDVSAWKRRLQDVIAMAARPVVIMAHRLGCHLAADVLTAGAAGVAGAYLVAPLSERAVRLLGAPAAALLPISLSPLPCPAVVVASRDDADADMAETEALAQAWHATLADAGHSGRIDEASGHGPWPEGLMRFAGFLKQL